MTASPLSTTKLVATILLVMTRWRTGAVFSSALVFPGGVVDPEDWD